MADRDTSEQPSSTIASGDDAAPYAGAGNQLRILRKQQGLTLDEISIELKIGRHFLGAIERGEFDKIPGTTYVLGFAQTYANLLKADTEGIAEALKAETSGKGVKPDLNFPEPVGEASMARGPVLIAALVLVAIVYGIWYFVISAPPEGRSIDFLPDRLSGYLSSPTSAALADEAVEAELPAEVSLLEPTLEPMQESLPAAEPETGDGAALELPAEDVATAPVEPSVELTVEPVIVAALNSDHTALEAEEPGELTPELSVSADPGALPGYVFHFTDQSWVRILDAEGETALVDLFELDAVVQMADYEGGLMTLGNAGAVDVYHNGELIGPMGQLGEVIYDFPLNFEALASRPEELKRASP